MKESLLIVAHGSRRNASNDEIRTLVQHISNMDHSFYKVKAAFLEIASPSIPDGITELIEGGATAVTILPYFLSAGRHVTLDIPAEVKKASTQHPNISMHIAPYFGQAKEIPHMLLSQAKATTC